MKKLILSIGLLISVALNAQDTKIINDANAVERKLESNFTAIQVSSGIRLYLSQSNQQSLAVSASDINQLKGLITEVVNGTLKIYYDNKLVPVKGDNKRLTVYLSFKSINKLSADAGSLVIIDSSITADNIDLEVTSGAVISGKIQVKELNMNLTSGASVKISGRADKFIVNASTGAILDGYNCIADNAEVVASTGAMLQISVNKQLNAKASTGADIKYKGEAINHNIKKHTGGMVRHVK